MSFALQQQNCRVQQSLYLQEQISLKKTWTQLGRGFSVQVMFKKIKLLQAKDKCSAKFNYFAVYFFLNTSLESLMTLVFVLSFASIFYATVNENLTLYVPCIMFQCVDKLRRCNTSYE